VTYLSCAGTACIPATPIATSTAGPDFASVWTNQTADGPYRVSARAVDGAGNVAESSAQTVTVDNTAPTIALTAPAEGFATNVPTLTFAGTAGTDTGDTSTVLVRVHAGTGTSGPVVQTLTAAGAGSDWSVVGAPLGDGTYTVQAAQADAAGNEGTSAARTFRVDVTPPTVIAISSTNGTGKVDVGDTFRLTFSEALDPASVPTSTTIRISNSGGFDMLAIDGITDGAVSTGTTGIVRPNLAMALHGTVTLSDGDTVVSVRTGTCASNCAVAGSGGGPGALQFVPAPTLQDVVGNAAAGLTAVTLRVF
jgi:hypothetical protein